MKSIVKNIVNGIFAGLCISVGGAVFLACDIKYVGAVMFSVALICICILGYSLYTGKICYMVDKHDGNAFSVLLWGLFGNLVATVACGYLIRFGLPALGETANAICSAKLETQALWQTLIRGVFCGILIYLAVEVFKQKNSVVGIIFCIPVFVLSGFEHSIADMFYFAASGIVSLDAFVFIMVVIAGNSIGGMLIPALKKAVKL